MSINPENKYTQMQSLSYENDAMNWNINNLDPVVGSFNAHNEWTDYDTFLFKDIDNHIEKNVIDFGCGPGRNIVKFNSKFNNIDGVDLSQQNLNNARIWMNKHNVTNNNLYICNGVDLNIINDNLYDIVMSTICFQHICVYDIRFNYLKEFYRILKPDGFITIQMGYGINSPMTVDYYDNYYDANSTNRGCDTSVILHTQIEDDLAKIGFKNFKYYIRPTGPGDFHPNWIFFNAQK